jgi:hypothetical protein
MPIVFCNRLYTHNQSNTRARALAQWFNTSAFSVQPYGTFGNTSRNLIISSRTADLDAAIHKTIQISERSKAQLRLESFNVTNTAPTYVQPCHIFRGVFVLPGFARPHFSSEANPN